MEFDSHKQVLIDQMSPVIKEVMQTDGLFEAIVNKCAAEQVDYSRMLNFALSLMQNNISDERCKQVLFNQVVAQGLHAGHDYEETLEMAIVVFSTYHDRLLDKKRDYRHRIRNCTIG